MTSRRKPARASCALTIRQLCLLSVSLVILSASRGNCRGASKRNSKKSSVPRDQHSTGFPKLQKKDSTGSQKSELSKTQKAEDKIWIIDTFPYNGEMVVELRLKHLYRVVDEIIVVESRVTHSGKQKDFLYVERDRKIFEPYLSKVTFLIIDEFPAPEKAWVEENKGGWMTDPTVWHREIYQRDVAASKIQEKYAGTKYVVLCSDADEIPNREFAKELRTQDVYDQAHNGFYMAMNFSYYSFQWASPQTWMKGFAVSDVGLPMHTLSDYRMGNPYDGNVRQDGGWHFSYFMSAADIARKLNAFGHTEYNTDQYKDPDHLRKCLEEGKDLFNRGPSFDMLRASEDRKAGYPEGWKEFAKKLADLQKLPAASGNLLLKQTGAEDTA